MIEQHIRQREDQEERPPDILLVGNDPAAARLLTLAFTEFGKSVDTRVATSGQRALEILDHGDDGVENRPDTVVLDVDTLVESGRDLLPEIREAEANESPPVIIFSRNDDPDVVRDYTELGAATYLIKPGNYEGLEDVVEEANTIAEAAVREDRVPVEVE